MVTAELAVAILAALSLAVLLCWGVFLLVMQLRCVDAAASIARQEARNDRSAVSAARRAAPGNSVVRVNRRAHQVTVTLTVDPFVRGLAVVPLRADATVVLEPEPAR